MNVTDEFKEVLNKLRNLHKEKKDELEYKFSMFVKNLSSSGISCSGWAGSAPGP